MRKPTTRIQFVMRILPDVKTAAEKAAADNNRSLASYIETILMEQLKKDGYLK